MGLFGLAACVSPKEEHTDEEWNQLLIDALEPLDHVTELAEFNYSMQGMISKDSAWISGIVISDTDDVATNEALLDKVGKIVASIHRHNPAKRSWVKVDVRGPAARPFTFDAKLDKGVVTIDDLVELYGVER